MTLTLMEVAQRVETLEKQMAELMNATPDNKQKKEKKEKKEKPEKKQKKNKKEDKSSDDEEPKKKKRVSGYNLYVKANRDDALASLAEASDEKPKSSEVMKKLGAMWKELDSEEQTAWNTKAKSMSDDDDA